MQSHLTTGQNLSLDAILIQSQLFKEAKKSRVYVLDLDERLLVSLAWLLVQAFPSVERKTLFINEPLAREPWFKAVI